MGRAEEDFKAWKKLLLRQTGTGWCPIKGTIIMDEERWKKARADILGCGKFKKMGLQNIDELERCFDDITSIGVEHWSPHMATASSIAGTQPEATQDEELGKEIQDEARGQYFDTTEFEQPSPANPNGKRPMRLVDDKGKKPKTGTAVLIQEAVSSLATSANSYASSKEGKFTIAEIMEHVVACGAEYGSNEHFIASELFEKEREMFMTMPSENRKV